MGCSNHGCGCGPKSSKPVSDREGPSQADIARFSNVTRTCPACKKEVFDDVDVCYHCGEAIQATTRAQGGMPTWAMITAGILLVGFVAVFVLR